MALRISTPRLTSAITLNSFAPQFLGQLRLPSFLSIYQWRDTWQRASLSAVLAEIFGPFLWAVPKQKTSYRRKRIRAMANSSLKDVTNFGKCMGCGRLKRSHHLCEFCYKDFCRRAKKERRAGTSDGDGIYESK